MQSKWPETSIASRAYSHIAPIYDYVMRHVDYALWSAYIKAHLQRERVGENGILEIACGTGTILNALAPVSGPLLGMDRSPEMLHIARRKCRGQGQQFLFWCGDMRSFALAKPVSAILCLYDSINYCLTEDEIAQTLASVHRGLEAGGLFIFDICTLRTCRKYFRDFEDRGTCFGVDYMRRSTFDEAKERQVNEFWVRSRTNARLVYYERHVQKIYSLRAMKKMVMQDSCWEVLGIYHNFTRRPASERSFRIHFVLRKG